MYWGDANRNVIESADLDGDGRIVRLKEKIAGYYGFVLYDDNIYVTDWDYK